MECGNRVIPVTSLARFPNPLETAAGLSKDMTRIWGDSVSTLFIKAGYHEPLPGCWSWESHLSGHWNPQIRDKEHRTGVRQNGEPTWFYPTPTAPQIKPWPSTRVCGPLRYELCWGKTKSRRLGNTWHKSTINTSVAREVSLQICVSVCPRQPPPKQIASSRAPEWVISYTSPGV